LAAAAINGVGHEFIALGSKPARDRVATGLAAPRRARPKLVNLNAEALIGTLGSFNRNQVTRWNKRRLLVPFNRISFISVSVILSRPRSSTT